MVKNCGVERIFYVACALLCVEVAALKCHENVRSSPFHPAVVALLSTNHHEKYTIKVV